MTKGKMRLHLGCGRNILKGWTNVDALNFGQEFIVDLNKPWPFKDNSVSEILCEDVLEHLDSEEHFLKEMDRVLCLGGIARLRVPHFKCPAAYRITHKTFHSYVKWAQFPEPHDVQIISEVIKCRILTRIGLDWLANILPRQYEKFFYCTAVEIVFKRVLA